MWGAIIGDLAGSIYEFDQTNKISPITVDKLIPDNAFFSDDTILTIAIADAILNDKNYEYYLKTYSKIFKDYKPDFSPYFSTIFSPRYNSWVYGNTVGTSAGNGAMMRISPVGFMFNSYLDVVENAKLATVPSHNCEEAVKYATIVALVIYFARKHYSNEDIIAKLNLKYEHEDFTEFNVTCSKTINNCLYAVFSSNTFEEAVKKVISFGGDTDTNACIVGSMAEALYGIDDDLILQAKEKLPERFIKILDEAYLKIQNL